MGSSEDVCAVPGCAQGSAHGAFKSKHSTLSNLFVNEHGARASSGQPGFPVLDPKLKRGGVLRTT